MLLGCMAALGKNKGLPLDKSKTLFWGVILLLCLSLLFVTSIYLSIYPLFVPFCLCGAQGRKSRGDGDDVSPHVLTWGG